MVNIIIDRHKIIHILISCVSFLLIGHLISVYLLVNYPGARVEGDFLCKLVSLFNFNFEANLPTFFSSLLLLTNAILLTFIAIGTKNNKKKYRLWAGMAFVFYFLSLDEMITIHEHFVQPTDYFLNTSGYFKYAWIIPYGIIILILGIIYAKFLFSLPKRILVLFTIAATLFISGAIGMESLSAMHHENYGVNNLGFYTMYTIEEFMEISGSLIFCYALLYFLSLSFDELKVDLIK